MRSFDCYNPIAVTVCILGGAAIAMFSMNPVILALSFVSALVYCLIRNGLKDKGFHLFSLLFFIVMAVVNPLFNHNGVTVIFIMNDNPVTLEALIYGIFSALMIISVLYRFRSFTEIMTSDKLLYIFGALSPTLSLILSMALRFVPLFGRQLKKTENSRKALGLYKDDNIIDRMKGRLQVFSILITWGLENGIVTADSMTARGYGTGKRTSYSLFRWRSRDILLLISSLALTALTLFGLSMTGGSYYPYFSFPETDAGSITAYISYGILVFLPSIIEIKEALRWKFSELKI